MIGKTRGIVLRTIKYGDTSAICNIFTAQYGMQGYLIQGVYSSRSRANKAGMLQPATLLDMVVYHNANKTLQRIRDMQPRYVYQSPQEDVVRNTITLYSIELLLRLLPEGAPICELFELAEDYFISADKTDRVKLANAPLWFTIVCGNTLGYGIKGVFDPGSPYLSLRDGAFTSQLPTQSDQLTDDDLAALSQLMQCSTIEAASRVRTNADTRYRLTSWYVGYLQNHTQYMGAMRSLPILQALLH